MLVKAHAGFLPSTVGHQGPTSSVLGLVPAIALGLSRTAEQKRSHDLKHGLNSYADHFEVTCEVCDTMATAAFGTWDHTRTVGTYWGPYSS